MRYSSRWWCSRPRWSWGRRGRTCSGAAARSRAAAGRTGSRAGPAPDRLLGESGHDSLDGRGGDDRLEGHTGNDRMLGGLGNDTGIGSFGGDYVDGGPGDDVIDAFGRG